MSKATKIPKKFKNEDEERAFWDRTDTTELAEGELMPVKIEVKCQMQSVSIRLCKEDLDRIKVEAGRLGIGPTTLMRMWLREKSRHRQPVRQI